MSESVIQDLREALPVALSAFDPKGQATGLVIVDEINGFASVGCGPLAPPAPDARIAQMIAETDRLARDFVANNRPISVFLDTHDPGKPEPPYPPHCEKGTGQENLVPDLAWLERAPQATLIRKDCINGFVGAIDSASGANRMTYWIAEHRLAALLVVGICTDICVMDFVLTMLSARNHGLAPTLRDIAVFEPACATYDLPLAVAKSLGLPETAAHPRGPTHHMGLYFMASRGAIIAGHLA